MTIDRLTQFWATSLLAAALVLGGRSRLQAEIRLPAIFGSHMVLQQGMNLPVWGTAAAGEMVLVTLGDHSAKAMAGADGRWRVILPPLSEGAGPLTMTVAGKNTVRFDDVVAGEVWLCSGQSNMELPLSRAINAPEIVPGSADDKLRLFLVQQKASPEPLADLTGHWELCTPESAAVFSGTAYFFGRELREKLHRPIGLIGSYWGGTYIEAWMSQQCFDQDPELKAGAAVSAKRFTDFPVAMRDYVQQLRQWREKNRCPIPPPADAQTVAVYAAPGVDTSDWKTIHLPGNLAEQGLPDAGVIWLRRKTKLPPAMHRPWPAIELGVLHDFETVYWNGSIIEATTPETGGSGVLRHFMFDPEQYKGKAPGEVVVAIRLAAPAGGAALTGTDAQLHFGSFTLAGEWQAKAETVFPALDDAARKDYPKLMPPPPRVNDAATQLYNAMIHPMAAYPIKGALWYQGEANAGRAVQYKIELPLMIRDWRARWGEGDFAFYLCQLPAFGNNHPLSGPGESAWAEMREAQASVRALAHTGVAVLIDTGELTDIHPRNKQTPGQRLAALALTNDYGQPTPASGPQYESVIIDGAVARVSFRRPGNGLVAHPVPATLQPSSSKPDTMPLSRNAPGGDLEGFAVCGDDHKWHWAEARIEGDNVLVHAADVPRPVAVRYAWSDYPICNLFDRGGLPAEPFRTDHFPEGSEKARYNLK